MGTYGKGEKRKDAIVSVYFTKAEAKLVRKKAGAAVDSVSSFIRREILEKSLGIKADED